MKKKETKIKGRSKEKELCWDFPSTGHGREDGFADSGIETFAGDYKKYIARETIQNSVDARLDPSLPVRVTFEQYSIPVKDLPGHGELLDRAERCSDFVAGQEKAEEFFKSAIGILKGKNITMLKISDFNTAGLTGSDNDRSGNWYRLVRVTGTSSPKGVAGGSFGIGKGAPFAGSAIRTVYYSSINEKKESVFQGVARLVSHYDDRKDVRQGVGFFGIDGYNAVRDVSIIPKNFRRAERGTDIYIAGFKTDPDWKAGLIHSILDNFWLAIFHGVLEVVVKDDDAEILINAETLRELFDEYEAHNAKFYFEAVTMGEKFTRSLEHIGEVFLYVRKQDHYPSRVMKVRKPKMFVEEYPCRSLREPYAGVFICENDIGNRFLRDLEPPAHDKWDKDRNKEEGTQVLRELDKFIRESLKSMGETITGEPQDIPGLNQYLPDSDDKDDLNQQGIAFDPTDQSNDEESGREIGAVKPRTSAEVEPYLRRSLSVKSVAPGKGMDPGGGAKNSSDGGSKGGKRGGEDMGDTPSDRIRTSDISFKSFMQKSGNELEYHFVITGIEDASGSIRIVAVGDDAIYPAEIKSAAASGAKTQIAVEAGGSMIKGLSIKRGETIRLAVRLLSQHRYALSIENYEG